MNYQEARQLSDKSGWHMTIRNDGDIWTHSCCRDPGPPATEEDMLNYGYQFGEPTLGKPHTPHATREEAEECYHNWRIDQVIKTTTFTDELHSDWTGCVICDAPTKGGARYNPDHYPEYVALCPDHRTLDNVLDQIGRVTQMIYS